MDTSELNKKVKTFSRLMRIKLVENAHKGGWENDAAHLLLARVCEELAELVEAIQPEKDSAEEVFRFAHRDLTHAAEALRTFGPYLKTSGDPKTVGNEAADVANMILMVADVLGALEDTETAEATDHKLFHRGLLAIAQDLHMFHTGATDAVNKKDIRMYRDYVGRRLAAWRPSPSYSTEYDACVKRMCELTMKETEGDE